MSDKHFLTLAASYIKVLRRLLQLMSRVSLYLWKLQWWDNYFNMGGCVTFWLWLGVGDPDQEHGSEGGGGACIKFTDEKFRNDCSWEKKKQLKLIITITRQMCGKMEIYNLPSPHFLPQKSATFRNITALFQVILFPEYYLTRIFCQPPGLKKPNIWNCYNKLYTWMEESKFFILWSVSIGIWNCTTKGE